MSNEKSAILIDDNSIDNFINYKLLQSAGINNVITFNNALNALEYLKKTKFRYQLILLDVYMPFMDGFEFIEEFYKLELNKKQGEIFLLSNSVDPTHKTKSSYRRIKFMEKPLMIEALIKKRKSAML